LSWSGVAPGSRDGKLKYILDKSLFPGTEISGASVLAPTPTTNRFDWSSSST